MKLNDIHNSNFDKDWPCFSVELTVSSLDSSNSCGQHWVDDACIEVDIGRKIVFIYGDDTSSAIDDYRRIKYK